MTSPKNNHPSKDGQLAHNRRDDNHTVDYTAQHPDRLIVVTGATGYVGGRLITELLHAGFRVRATSRHLSSLRRFPWFEHIEPVEADLRDPADVARLCDGADSLFYLVHSMGDSREDFEEVEQETARNVATAAENAGLRQITYLSGLHPKDIPTEKLSKHMRSREKVARILLDSAVPSIVFQAATLIGSGSASYEMIRHLTERLPIMVAPKWIDNLIEPISIRDALYYLVASVDLDEPVNRAFDLGGGHRYRFSDLLRLYGKERGLKRFIRAVPLPLPMDTLSGMWIALVTPAPLGLSVPLAQSMAKDSVTTEHDIAEFIPDPAGGLADYPTSVRRALHREQTGTVETSWDGSWRKAALVDPAQRDVAQSQPTDAEWSGHTVYTDIRTSTTSIQRDKLWEVIEGIGGDRGWYSAGPLWTIRGLLDKIAGGPGLGGRRDPVHLRENDRVDWWRVEKIVPQERLVLRAEMKLDGRAWLIFELSGATDSNGHPTGETKYTQRALYYPQGLAGRLYWGAMLPFHRIIFPVMVKNILKAAEHKS
ncbi:SDR family oxidoreductase [Corynebacterium auriscanis]|uniref:SDR family oxidoreductase n=1 Tax=Corynebacterium TaxID=1716 RepID=UPI0009F2E0E6|nr:MULTISPECIES: SDR family oxidoreductase [Corynebacterium]